jgi:hypothetical protein
MRTAADAPGPEIPSALPAAFPLSTHAFELRPPVEIWAMFCH